MYRSQIECACRNCGASFFKRPSEVRKGEYKFCSRKCVFAGRARSEVDRFWAKVETGAGCWTWSGARKQRPWDYGVLGGTKKGEVGQLAHRVSWRLHHGPIPDGMKVLHHCDNPPCVNPEHLFLGSLKDNTQDMLEKGRHSLPIDHSQGEKNPGAKLTEKQVVEMRNRYSLGGVTQQQLADHYNVCNALVSFIITRKLWRNI